jgi:hypothetical protein
MDRRTGALLVAGACVPFAAATLVERADVELPCPFRDATGLPCPLCGATRAFALAARGDLGFLDYNAVWVAVAAVVVLAGLLRKAPPAWAYVAVMAVAWGYALANRAAITG